MEAIVDIRKHCCVIAVRDNTDSDSLDVFLSVPQDC